MRTTIVLAVAAIVLNGPALAQDRAVLYKDARAELALARADGRAEVMLVIASREGGNGAVVRAIEAAGGDVRFRDDGVSYVRALVPIDAVESILDAAPIEGATIDPAGPAPGRALLASRSFEAGAAASADLGASAHRIGVERSSPAAPTPAVRVMPDTVWPPRLSDYPLRNPYSPLRAMGAEDLRRTHPTYDGRGVTIGHVEGQVDLLAPELATAYTVDGEPTRKIADYLTAVAPDLDGPSAGHWVSTTPVDARTGRFTHVGESYVAPRRGEFRFGVYEDMRLCQLLSAAGPPSGTGGGPAGPPACRFGVLWDPTTGDVWLDTNRDGSFADERALREYRRSHDFGTIGEDAGATGSRGSFAFVVQPHAEAGAVAILTAIDSHATMVAGTVAGNREPDGLYDGIAPGARVIAYSYHYSAAGVSEALIAAFKDPRVDIVLFEQNVFVAVAYRLGDGRFPPTIITSRLIERYGKPFVAPGTNRPATSSVSEHGNARWGFTAGASQSRDAWRINDAVLVRHEDNLHQVGAWGPGPDGSVKPTVLAPAGILSSSIPPPGRWRAGRQGLYALPPGYTIGGGTSQAAPSLAGAIALLISAARQEGVPYDPRRIWLALTHGARFIPQIDAHKQGNGVVDVAAALELLRAYATAPPVIKIESRGPVRAAHGADLVTPHVGVGIWEREGWRAGMREMRMITLTRASGPDEPMPFALRWLGNRGAFTAPASVVLPLGVPVAVEIGIAPETPGMHSALLEVDHPSVPGPAHRVMAAVVAADRFEPENGFVIEKADAIERPEPSRSYYIHVPGGAGAFVVELSGPEGTRLHLGDPLGREIGGDRFDASGRRAVLVDPMPGVWELGVFARHDGLALRWASDGAPYDPPVPIRLTASLLGAEVRLDPSGGGRATEIGAAGSAGAGRTLNAYASFTGGTVATGIGSLRTVRATIGRREQQVHDILVPEDAELLEVAVPQPFAVDAELDLYLHDCTGPACVSAANAVGPAAERRIRVERPAAGTWKLIVDSPRAGPGGAEYKARLLLLRRSLGATVANDAPAERASGQTWEFAIQPWFALATTAGTDSLVAALIVRALQPDGSWLRIGMGYAPVAGPAVP